MPWGLAIAAVGTIAAADMQGDAAKDAASASAAGSGAAIAEDRRQYNQTRSDQMPFLEAGYGALRRQNEILNGDFTSFESAPDYLFTRDQSLQALDRSAAARGGFTGGGADADRISLANGLALQNVNSYWNKLAGQTGQGQVTASNLGALGAQSAQNVGNYLQGAANTRASSYLAQGNANASAMNQLGGGFSTWYGSLGQDSQGRYLGNQRGAG